MLEFVIEFVFEAFGIIWDIFESLLIKKFARKKIKRRS